MTNHEKRIARNKARYQRTFADRPPVTPSADIRERLSAKLLDVLEHDPDRIVELLSRTANFGVAR